MSIKGIDQRPYDREKFNSEFDRIFGKKKHENDSKRNGAEASKKVRNNSTDGSSTRL